jgi:hypothetical protein
MAIHSHTPSPRRTHTYRCTNLKANAHTYNTNHTNTPLSQATKHGALLARATADGADFTLHKTHTHHSPMSNSHTNKNSCGACTTPASSHTTPPCAAPCVANSPATATWPATNPLCPALDMTDTTARYNSSSPFLNVTTEAVGRV